MIPSTPEEEWWDQIVDAHERDECVEDCPVCREQREIGEESSGG